MFPKGTDCILSQFRVANSSLLTDTRSVSECLSYPTIGWRLPFLLGTVTPDHNGLRQ